MPDAAAADQPSKRHTAYHLHVDCGLSLRETARTMRISIRLVRRHVAAARAKKGKEPCQ